MHTGEGLKVITLFLARGQHKVFTEVASHLHWIGSANDAENHNYKENAERMHLEACASLRELLEPHPFLGELLPGLRSELDTDHMLGFGWKRNSTHSRCI